MFENGVFHSLECAGKCYSYTQNDLSVNQNVSCINLQYNQRLANLFDVSLESKSHTNYQCLGYNSLVKKLHSYATSASFQRLSNFNLQRENIMLRNRIDLYERFKLLIANNDIKRLRVVVGNCLTHGYGLKTIIQKMSLTINKNYCAKKWDDNELDLSVLVLRIGGPALLHAFNQLSMLPTSSVIYKVIYANCPS